MFRLGAPEILIVLVVFVILFGGKRIASLGKDLGSGIRSLRDALKELHGDDDG